MNAHLRVCVCVCELLLFISTYVSDNNCLFIRIIGPRTKESVLDYFD